MYLVSFVVRTVVRNGRAMSTNPRMTSRSSNEANTVVALDTQIFAVETKVLYKEQAKPFACFTSIEAHFCKSLSVEGVCLQLYLRKNPHLTKVIHTHPKQPQRHPVNDVV
jgi:hypothetical protein